MKEKFINALINLIKVKSIITLLTFSAFFILSIKDKIGIDNYMLILGMISTYFFNKTLKEIAGDECCSINAVKHSIDRALHTLSIKLKNSNFKD